MCCSIDSFIAQKLALTNPDKVGSNNLQLHMGNIREYISGKASIVSKGTGIDEISQETKVSLGLETEEKFMI
jgi:hypothetical protein